MKFSTICVKQPKDHLTTKPHQLPIYASSSFVFDKIEDGIEIFTGDKKGHVYSRYGNPTIDAVGQKLAELESFGLEGEYFGLMTSSGMSAISTVLSSLLRPGAKLITQGNLYGGTTELIKKVYGNAGTESYFVDLSDLNLLENYLKKHPEISVIYFETPSNPTLDCLDIQGICALAKTYDCVTVVDNTFCTPYLQKPLSFGVDYVIHSTTKYLSGHGNSIAGVIVGKEENRNGVWQYLKLNGTNCNPFDAWLVNNGLKTLALRMDKHSSNAMSLARYLSQKPEVSKVNYNGLETHPFHEVAKKQMCQFGGMLSFEMKEGKEAAIKFMNQLKLSTLAPTLGDVDTLILHPVTSSHLNVPKEMCLANGITDGLIRVSVGIEDFEDLKNDFESGFAI